MGKVNLIISESFINNLSEYLIACGIKIPSLVVKIWKTDADLEKGNCQIVNLGSASLYQIVENLTSLYEEDGCAEICFNDSYCDECLIHSDKYELYLIDDHLKRLEEQAVLKTEEKEREWKKLEIRKRASFFKAPMCIPVNRWDTQKVDNFYEVFFLQKELSIETPREASEMFHSTNSAQNPAFCGLWVHSLKTSDKVLKYGENNRVDFSEHPTVVKRGSVRTINIYAAVPDVA